MHAGLGIQEHGAEYAGKPEKILVLNPGGAGALIHLHAKPVVLLPHIGGQVEIRGGKAVLGVADKMSVQPEIKGLLHALEADADLLAAQSRLQVEHPDIAAHGTVLPVDFRGTQFGAAIPGIQGVDILDLPVSLQFHVSGDLNGPEAGAVKVLPPEILRPGCGLWTPGKAPHAVQRLAQGSFALKKLLHGRIADMVGVGVQTAVLKDRGVGQPVEVSVHIESSFVYMP